MALTFGGLSQAIIASMFGGALANKQEGFYVSGPNTNANEANVSFTDERAMQVSAVWSCVRLLTETVGTLPLKVYERTSTGRKEVESHPVKDLFTVAPNAMMTPLAFREAMTAQLVLWGNAYAMITRNGNRITAITPLRAGCTTPKREANTVTYHYSTDKGTHILHLKGFGADGIVGFSPLRYAAQTLGTTVAAEQYAAHAFSSGGRPSGVLSMDRVLSDVQRDQLRSIYENVTASDGLWVLEGGVKFEPISIPPDDLQMLGSRQFQLGEIARIFRVPSYLINDTEKSTSWGTGIEQQNLGFLAYSLRPYLVRWESAVNSQLFSTSEQRKYFVEHTVEGLLRADSSGRASFYSQMAQNGILSRNEIRARENLPPVDGADDLTVQVNLTPVDQLTKVNANVGNQIPPG
jgi:HK97 family phage portal protein